MVILLDSQIQIYSADTGDFYSNHEAYLHKLNHQIRMERNQLIKGGVYKNFHSKGKRNYIGLKNIEKQLYDLVPDTGFDKSEIARGIQNKFFEFLDMAGNFFTWTRDLCSFNTSVYLGPSPNSNKEAVIKNWKLYRDKDIVIDESKYDDDEEE